MNFVRQPWVIILLIVLIILLFGANKLPGLARNMGESMRIFKSEVEEMRKDDDKNHDDRRDDREHDRRDDRDHDRRDDRGYDRRDYDPRDDRPREEIRDVSDDSYRRD